VEPSDDSRRPLTTRREISRTLREKPAPKPVPGRQEYLTRAQAAGYAKVSVSTIDRARRSGELRSTDNGRRLVRIKRAWLDAWLAGALLLLVGLLAAACILLTPGGPFCRLIHHHHRAAPAPILEVPR